MIVIAGAGHAGFHAAAALRAGGYQGRLIMVGDEPHPPYQRPPLSKSSGFAAGRDRLLLRGPGFYPQNNIELRLNERATAIDRSGHRLVLSSGASLPYDHLILALGARGRMPPIEGIDLDGVHSLRSLDDAIALEARLGACGKLAVIGAGFIGLEVAATARKKGVDVTVIELASRILARAVCPTISDALHRYHLASGVRLHLATSVTRLCGRDGRVTGVEASDGRRFEADAVLVGIGAVPETSLASESGLAVEGGIVTDATLITSDPAISAIGDCARFPSPADGGHLRLESVQNATDQAKCVASRLLGDARPYAAVPWFWSDQGERKLQIAGLTGGCDETVVRGAPEGGSFSVFCYAKGRLLGVESVNAPADHMFARRLLEAGRTLPAAEAADPALDLKRFLAAGGAGPSG